jgi:hypothetical protein
MVMPASMVSAVDRGPESQASASKPPLLPAAPTELADLRSETSRTFDNHDGTLTSELFTQPIHYQPAGSDEWQPVDVGFQPASADGLLRRSDRAPLSIGLRVANASKGLLQLDGRAGPIAFRLVGAGSDQRFTSADVAASPPTVDGNVAEYREILPGVDLQVIAGARSAKTFLVLANADAPTTFTFSVDAPGLDLEAARDGSAVFRDPGGTIVGRIPRPYAVDSADEPLRGDGVFSDAVGLAVGEADGKPTLTVAVDPAWLKSASSQSTSTRPS